MRDLERVGGSLRGQSQLPATEEPDEILTIAFFATLQHKDMACTNAKAKRLDINLH